jgi:DNA topoisomerase-3
MEQTARDMVTCVYETFPDFGTLAAEPDIKRLINNKKVTGHHAIIPTEKIKTADLSALPGGQKNILMLVSARLICATSLSHKFESVKVSLSCENTPFTASGKTVLENGWKSVEEKTKNALASKNTDDDEEKDDTKTLPEITQGMTFENVSAEKCEHFTSPPKPYTEDTLLSAMEHAGAENFDENSEKKGLGTPATRAATIEGLVKHGYAERKGKKITATEKGVNLINVVPEEVKSPKLTADWEMQLQQIERGEHSADSFMGDITAFVQDICTKYGAVDSSVNFNGSKSEAIGKCPKCGGDIVKGKFGFYCKGKCGMNVAKVYGKELTEAQITKLLSGKEISYTANGKKTIVIPEVGQNDYNGKTYYNWKTKKG